MNEVPAAAYEHLDRLDAAVPGLIEGIHIVGSVPLGDYHAETSDLDLVVELGAPPNLGLLLPAYQGAGLQVETIFVRTGELDGDLRPGIATASIRDGSVQGTVDLHAVTWLQLARYSVTLRGERPRPRVDAAAVRSYCRRNLIEYWTPTLHYIAARPGDDYLIQWLAMGPIRLRQTVSTGEIISKSQGLEIAAARFPDLADSLLDIRARRHGYPLAFTNDHHHAALELARRVLGHPPEREEGEPAIG
jgi:streptomycin 3"-adenylyltransferase